jgi:hypothetical protein
MGMEMIFDAIAFSFSSNAPRHRLDWAHHIKHFRKQREPINDKHPASFFGFPSLNTSFEQYSREKAEPSDRGLVL